MRELWAWLGQAPGLGNTYKQATVGVISRIVAEPRIRERASQSGGVRSTGHPRLGARPLAVSPGRGADPRSPGGVIGCMCPVSLMPS